MITEDLIKVGKSFITDDLNEMDHLYNGLYVQAICHLDKKRPMLLIDQELFHWMVLAKLYQTIFVTNYLASSGITWSTD